ncbi:hypothetical protein [Phenylobacterium sp.]|uniref:hypothetical protein n=1 Tax=Phenylobacterium sp. TaxID=1871053 RepID=UPI00301E4852
MSALTDLTTARDVLERAQAFRTAYWMTAAGRSTHKPEERDHLVVQCFMGQGTKTVRIDVADAARLADVLPGGVL